MAIQINTNVETTDGFTVQPFCYLLIQMSSPNVSSSVLQYYKSEQDFIDGKSPITIQTLPSFVNLQLTGSEFWGPDLATLIHNKCIAAIEEVTGADTCDIVTL